MTKWMQALALLAIPILCVALIFAVTEYALPQLPGWLQGLLFGIVAAYCVFAVGQWLVGRYGGARTVIATFATAVSIMAVMAGGYYFVPIPPYGVTLQECRNISAAYSDTLGTDFIQSSSWERWPSASSMNGEEAKQFGAFLMTAHALEMDVDTLREKATGCNRMLEDINER